MRSSRRYATAASAESALEDLVEAGIGTWREDDHDRGRGRPVRRFDLADAVDEAESGDLADDLLAEEPDEDPEEWGEV